MVTFKPLLPPFLPPVRQVQNTFIGGFANTPDGFCNNSGVAVLLRGAVELAQDMKVARKPHSAPGRWADGPFRVFSFGLTPSYLTRFVCDV